MILNTNKTIYRIFSIIGMSFLLTQCWSHIDPSCRSYYVAVNEHTPLSIDKGILAELFHNIETPSLQEKALITLMEQYGFCVDLCNEKGYRWNQEEQRNKRCNHIRISTSYGLWLCRDVPYFVKVIQVPSDVAYSIYNKQIEILEKKRDLYNCCKLLKINNTWGYYQPNQKELEYAQRNLDQPEIQILMDTSRNTNDPLQIEALYILLDKYKFSIYPCMKDGSKMPVNREKVFYGYYNALTGNITGYFLVLSNDFFDMKTGPDKFHSYIIKMSAQDSMKILNAIMCRNRVDL